MLTKTVCVWFDKAATRSEKKRWVVSVDMLDGDGAAESSKTLGLYSSKKDAQAAARETAAIGQLPLKGA